MTSQTIRPRRSALYMPASNARALEKARTLPADVLLLDLEDAVAPDQKETARRQVVDAVRAGGYGRREVVVRVNGLGTPWFDADLKAVASAGPDAILLPKVEMRNHLAVAQRTVTAARAGTPLPLWAMIETPRAILNVSAIAGAESENLAVLVLGTNDLVKETGAAPGPDRAEAMYWLQATVTAARAHGLDVLDGVFNAFKDMPGFLAECRQGRRLGMTGKTLIHPDQIGPANEVFAPSPDELERARRIVAAFELPENRGKGAITLDGRMVELLHADIARKTIALAGAIERAAS